MKIKSTTVNRYDDYFNPASPFITGAQASRCIVELERNGFSVNVPLLNSKCEVARNDEKIELDNLRKEYAEHGFPYKSDDDIDAIWSSPKQLIELCHEWLGLEYSPIYKKGQVATWKGEVRLDGVALDYLGNKYREHRVFLHRIRNLRTIRGCIKYLSKLPLFVNPDGLIHPTYGPMGDDDERSGTHTGRLGMKNPEGHQIPLDIEKDPYGIRECFNVPAGYVKVVRDYQAMEVVILAWLCDKLFGDKSLFRAVDLGGEFHTVNSYNVFGTKLGWSHPSGRYISEWTLDEYKKLVKTDDYFSCRRKDAKTVWYGAQYRKSGRGFGYTLLNSDGEPIGEKAGQDVLDAFLEEAPALNRWYAFTDEWLEQYLYMPGPSGRIRDLHELLGNNRATGKKDWQFRSAARKGGNHPMQELCAAIKMAAIWELINNKDFQHLGGILEVEIHDELHARCPDDPIIAQEVNAVVGECMENVCKKMGLPAKTDGGVGYNWTEAK